MELIFVALMLIGGGYAFRLYRTTPSGEIPMPELEYHWFVVSAEISILGICLLALYPGHWIGHIMLGVGMVGGVTVVSRLILKGLRCKQK